MIDPNKPITVFFNKEGKVCGACDAGEEAEFLENDGKFGWAPQNPVRQLTITEGRWQKYGERRLKESEEVAIREL